MGGELFYGSDIWEYYVTVPGSSSRGDAGGLDPVKREVAKIHPNYYKRETIISVKSVKTGRTSIFFENREDLDPLP